MLDFLKSDPAKKLQKQYEAKLGQALHAQRNGDLRTHGTLMQEADAIYQELQKVKNSR